MKSGKARLRHGSLFSGIGGFDLAAEWMGWTNVFHCELNPFCQRILKYYFPQALSYEDIKKTDFSKHNGQIDILTGGFPCQPYSVAGKRLGKDDERHLWPEMLRAVRQIRPTWVVGENVLGIVSWNGGMVFEEVQLELEAQGYEVQPFVLPAAGVNAPHRRDRVWFVAYAECYNDIRKKRGSHEETQAMARKHRTENSASGQSCGTNFCDLQRVGQIQYDSIHAGHGAAQDKRPEPADLEKKDKRRKTGGSEHATVQDHWANWPTQSPICTGNDGLSLQLDGITFPKWRTESIKAGGNAIVPQVAYQLFRAIQLTTHEYSKR